MSDERVVGLDFGTSTTSVAEPVGPDVRVVPLGATRPWIETVAGLTEAGWIFGDEAERLPAERVVRSVKSYITQGTHPLLAGKELGEDATYSLIEGILRTCREAALIRGDGLDLQQARVRLGCPAIWVGHQRRRLAEAAREAGLNADVDDMVDEPVAAGVDWIWESFLRDGERHEGRVLVIDIGGGTTDIALLQVEFSAEPEISVLACRGVAQAGDSVDAALAGRLLEHFEELQLDDLDPSDDLLTTYLYRAARIAKVGLTSRDHVSVGLDEPYGSMPRVTLGREALDHALAPTLRSVLDLADLTLREAHMRDAKATVAVVRDIPTDVLDRDVTHVLLTGGMSAIPAVQEAMTERFPSARVHAASGDGTTTRVVRGFARTQAYRSLNLNRPGMDIVLRWQDSGSTHDVVLFEAFSPLFEWWQVLQGISSYERTHRPAPVSGQCRGEVVLRSVGHEDVPLHWEGENFASIPVALQSNSRVTLRLSASGDLTVIDGSGRRHVARVRAWPYARFSGLRSTLVAVEARPLEGTRFERYAGVDTWRHK